MTPKTADAAGAELGVASGSSVSSGAHWTDLRAIVRPDVEDERRFAAVRRLSEINLGLYRTLLQPFVRAFASEQVASRQHELQPSELPFEMFSDRNPLMRQVAQLAEQVREQRSPCSAGQPFVKLQGMVSSQIIAALDGWRDLRDQSVKGKCS